MGISAPKDFLEGTNALTCKNKRPFNKVKKLLTVMHMEMCFLTMPPATKGLFTSNKNNSLPSGLEQCRFISRKKLLHFHLFPVKVWSVEKLLSVK